MISAQVVLRPAAGAFVPDAELIAGEINRLAPDPDAASAARAWFDDRGLQVSEVTGNSFSITGNAELFERELDDRATSIAEKGGELSTRLLPKELSSAIEAITFTPGEPLR